MERWFMGAPRRQGLQTSLCAFGHQLANLPIGAKECQRSLFCFYVCCLYIPTGDFFHLWPKIGQRRTVIASEGVRV